MRSANVLGFVALRVFSEGNVGGRVAHPVSRPLSLLLWLILSAASGGHCGSTARFFSPRLNNCDARRADSPELA